MKIRCAMIIEAQGENETELRAFLEYAVASSRFSVSLNSPTGGFSTVRVVDIQREGVQ